METMMKKKLNVILIAASNGIEKHNSKTLLIIKSCDNQVVTRLKKYKIKDIFSVLLCSHFFKGRRRPRLSLISLSFVVVCKAPAIVIQFKLLLTKNMFIQKDYNYFSQNIINTWDSILDKPINHISPQEFNHQSH